jgi:snurportin-1
MEDLLAGFEGTLSVATDVYDVSRPHPRFSQYKIKREGYGDQEARRMKALEDQGKRRKDFFDHSRRIVEGHPVSEDEMDEGGGYDEVDSQMDVGSHHVKKYRPPYRNQLMLSEWMVDVPMDFQSNWIMVVCPIAKRCLVLSARGVTKAYTRTGHHMRQFPSHLPGGARKFNTGKNDYCILDCLFDETSQTFYILDVMCWCGIPVYDSDTEFRLYWLNTKIQEFDRDIVAQTNTNPYRFIPLEHYQCSMEVLSKVFGGSWPVQVDGILFFHKLARYHLGRCPLVLWLKPHMVSEILRVPVSQEFLDCAPMLSSAKMETEHKNLSKRGTDNNMELTQTVINEC